MSDRLVDRLEIAAQWDDSPKELLNEAADYIEELERRNRELNYELGGVRRSYFEERKKVIALSKAHPNQIPNINERGRE